MANMHWLNRRRQLHSTVTFGVPWARGALDRAQNLTLTDQWGHPVPSQQKPLAYWPDGSVKWTAVSATAPSGSDRFEVRPGEPAQPETPITVEDQPGNRVTVDNGLVWLCVQPCGNKLISSMIRGDFEPISVTLAAYLETVTGSETGDETRITRRFTGKNRSVTVEESGPVRAVVRIRGVHEGAGREVLPFDVRLYVYAGSDEIRLVHNFVLDIRHKEEQLKGVAVEVGVPVRQELFNRHVAFAGDTGLFYEGVQDLFSTAHYRTPQQVRDDPQPMDDNVAEYRRQVIDGQFVYLDRTVNTPFVRHVTDNAVWNRFLLSQDSNSHYTISKSTQPECAMIPAAQGNRSAGTMFLGSKIAICAVSVRDFWQKTPTALEIVDARYGNTKMIAWLYSRYGESYDFRAYDTVSHKYSYGGINNYPEGIANTSELTIKLFGAMPGREAIWNFAQDMQEQSLLVGDVDLYADTKALGSYWLPAGDAGDPAAERAMLELTKFYIDEVERRKWYGFWDYGDVMHSYDIVRHCWLYDTGGRAWQNTELCNTYVHWLLFLRTGDAEIFRFARAMTRHCSDVDTYHAGPYAMLGTRHNVRHWGCGAKEARISMAGHHRFFYYLTGDERVGDVMDEVKDVDQNTVAENGHGRDPMGSYFPPHPGFSHIRIGPDWSSFVSNWMTRWERFEDTKYRDKILTGIRTIAQAPLRMASGSTFHYDPKTGAMYYMGAPNPAGHTHPGDGNYQQHMVVCFGGPETWFELSEILEDPEFTDMVAQLASYYFMTPEQRTEASGGRFNETNMRAWRGEKFGVRMRAFYGWYSGKPEEVQAAMDYLLPDYDTGTSQAIQGGVALFGRDGSPNVRPLPAIWTPVPTVEVPALTTNDYAQWCLNYMETAHFRALSKTK